MSQEFMVWYAPGVREVRLAESIRDCAKQIRDTTDERTFAIAPIVSWKDFQMVYNSAGERENLPRLGNTVKVRNNENRIRRKGAEDRELS